MKKGEKAGFPRFKSRARYDSIIYTDPCKIESNTKAAGWSLCNSKLTLSKIGSLAKTSIKIKLHRGVMGRVCQLTIKRESVKWFACFSVVYLQSVEVALPSKAVGVDVGLNSFAVFSNGEQLANPRFYRKNEEKLALAQQKASGKKRGSNRCRKAKREVASMHRKISSQRRDFLHKASRKLVNKFDAIFFEDLSIDNMVRRPQPKADPDKQGSFVPNGAAAKGG